jgi:uncharacterized membrane protein
MRSLEVLELKMRDRVRAKTKHLINSGKIIKTACRGCGSTKVEAHHYNYDNPYSVVFLCVKHHKAEHARLNKLNAKVKTEMPLINIELIISNGTI